MIKALSYIFLIISVLTMAYNLRSMYIEGKWKEELNKFQNNVTYMQYVIALNVLTELNCNKYFDLIGISKEDKTSLLIFYRNGKKHVTITIFGGDKLYDYTKMEVGNDLSILNLKQLKTKEFKKKFIKMLE